MQGQGQRAVPTVHSHRPGSPHDKTQTLATAPAERHPHQKNRQTPNYSYVGKGQGEGLSRRVYRAVIHSLT